MTKKKVLLRVLIQDPSVPVGRRGPHNAIQPVIVRDEIGFLPGPVCRRLAIVDLDYRTGKLGPPVPFDLKESLYKGVTGYRATLPTTPGQRHTPWTSKKRKRPASHLTGPRFTDAFLKVSVFGAALRTIAMVEHAAVLGRAVRWAFPGEQLLIVPRAGEMDNAFYHRESRSIQLFYFAGGDHPEDRVYSALSQDIVVHETAHALIDAIAPDLYDAVSPETLAIHEGVADITAVLVSLRNREQIGQHMRGVPNKAADELRTSSRFSRIAEEFGRWRGHGDALRDACNLKTLDPRVADASRRVDATSPHSLSEVLTGAFFAVTARTFARALRTANRLGKVSGFGPWIQASAMTNERIGSLVFKGLDWMPPGDVSFGEFVSAALAADTACLPEDEAPRKWLRAECRQRRIDLGADGEFVPAGLARHLDPRALFAAARSSSAARRFVLERCDALEILAGRSIRVRASVHELKAPSLRPPRPTGTSEVFDLFPPKNGRVPTVATVAVVKVSWRVEEENDVGSEFGRRRAYRRGLTIVADSGGRLLAVLHGGRDPSQRQRRSGFLKSLIESGTLMPPGARMGPDGRALAGSVSPRLHAGLLSVGGAFRALHVAGDSQWSG